MLRLAADPKRWISVTAPLSASSGLNPAWPSRWRVITRHLQHRRHQLGLCGQQQAQRDRQRQHPLAYRNLRNDLVHQVGHRLCHASGPA